MHSGLMDEWIDCCVNGWLELMDEWTDRWIDELKGKPIINPFTDIWLVSFVIKNFGTFLCKHLQTSD